jgi:hypothetical protein
MGSENFEKVFCFRLADLIPPVPNQFQIQVYYVN